jgi:glycolate oxidase FAD binding subunit
MPGVIVDGVPAAEVVAPFDARRVAETLAEAAARGQAVVPIGGGTALALGNPPERIDAALSMERLSRILDYEPTDLVLSVEAGARLADVQAVLAEHGQRLPIDPPGMEAATIGGVIATGRWGPLRHSAGTLRDLLIGIAVAHPSGTLSKAGGMVVKIVTGYEIPRLYEGSLGTLGVIISANFKVLPRPRAEATIVASFSDAAAAFAAADRLRRDHLPLTALEVARRDGCWLVAVRIEGREQTVDALAAKIEQELGGGERWRDAESAAWWVSYVAAQRLSRDDDLVLIRCGARPRETATLAKGIAAASERLGIAAPLIAASPGTGTVVAAFDLGETGSAERLAEVQAVMLALAETVTILSAPAPWKAGIDIWGRPPDGIAVMRALREQFDPGRTINPGRFVDFL